MITFQQFLLEQEPDNGWDSWDAAWRAWKRQERMEKAFALVTPEKFGAKDWRCSINAWVTQEELVSAGVTIDDVREAVLFYTATPAYISGHLISFGQPEKGAGYIIRALGYRKGPAGP